MGVYHFMGLGRSVGAITAPLSYLADRYERNNDDDQAFFARSGGSRQPESERRGYVEGLVLFTTAEIFDGTELALKYKDNSSGKTNGRPTNDQSPVKEVLQDLLPDILKPFERSSIDVYWCEIEANFDPLSAFKRVARVLVAAKPEKKKGKEVWVNLTGGSNIINTSLQMAISLLGRSGRMYYTFTRHPELICHPIPKNKVGTNEDDFWVKIPILYSVLNPKYRLLLEQVATHPNGEMTMRELYEVLQNDQDENFHLPKKSDGRPKDFELDGRQALCRQYILPLYTQNLLNCRSDRTGNKVDVVRIGDAWEQLQDYYNVVEQADKIEHHCTLKDLKQEDWFHHEPLSLI